ncbi:reverse transcriptase family protein [Streptococcus halichoeri]|uniref:reverse transcriptase family protein n=1 Tax=Streptococcus halichoeri TaxID=254785 RepID=UPI001C8E1049
MYIYIYIYISVPSEHLKAIQKWIVKNILDEQMYSDFAHAYTKSRSIFTNAELHIGNRILLKMDIHNFFDSISFEMVKEIFISLNYNNQVASDLARLCTYHGYVRQGFVSSPIISNIILASFDNALNELLLSKKYIKYNLKYTRYSDDITISSASEEIVEMKDIIDEVSSLLEENGFEVNQSKTKIIKGTNPKVVTGVIVKSNSISIPRKFKKELLKELHFCERFGVQSHLIYTGKFGKLNYKEHLEGIANFIRNTDSKFYEQVIERIRKLDIDA